MKGTMVFVVSLLATGSWTLLVGCEGSPEPPTQTAPSDPTIGIYTYTDANFQGNSWQFTSDLRDLRNWRSDDEECNSALEEDLDSGVKTEYRSWDDCLSSVRVMPGWSATLYEDRDFKGRSLELLADTPNLQLMMGPCRRNDWNDCTSSIRIRKR